MSEHGRKVYPVWCRMAGIRDSIFEISLSRVRSIIAASIESSSLKPVYCQKRLDLGEKLLALCHSCKDATSEQLSAMVLDCREVPIDKIKTFVYARVFGVYGKSQVIYRQGPGTSHEIGIFHTFVLGKGKKPVRGVRRWIK